jgi:hypothetical protein
LRTTDASALVGCIILSFFSSFFGALQGLFREPLVLQRVLELGQLVLELVPLATTQLLWMACIWLV